MQTSGNRKELSLVSKLQGVELPIRVPPTCRELVLTHVMKHRHVLRFGLFLDFYQARNGSNRSIIVDDIYY